MLRRFAEYETSIFRAKRVLMIINGALMIINVQKITSAKRDVNLIFSKNQYFTKKGIDLAYNTKSMPYMGPLTSEDQCSPVR